MRGVKRTVTSILGVSMQQVKVYATGTGNNNILISN